MPLFATVNVVGPEGRTIQAGMEIPDDWDEETKSSLLESGGAEEKAWEMSEGDDE